MKKICIDCRKSFECSNNRCERCPECQLAYRNRYQKEYQEKTQHNKRWWKDKPAASHKYYQFWRFITTLTDNELQALVTKYIGELNYASTYAEKQDFKTYIKMLEYEYSKRKNDREIEKEKGQKEDDERKIAIKDGVSDE